jgi:hypothetical protein
MIDSEVEKIINKPLKLWAADRTREPLTDASVRCASV